jgi:hypothetical protein
MALGAIGSEFQVNSVIADAGADPSVAGHADGSFLVTWTGPQAPEPDDGPRPYSEIIGRAFAYSSPLSGDFVVNTELRDPQFSSDVAARADGSYVVAYSSGVEDQLPGTFIASQIISGAGVKIGAEVYSPDYSYYHVAPDVAAFADGGYVIVSGQEVDGDGYIYAANASLSSTFSFGFSDVPLSKAVTELGDGNFFVAWSGYDVDISNFPDDHAPLGIHGQVRSADGTTVGFPFLIAELDGPGVPDVDPVAKVLPNGDVVLAWTATPAGGTNGSEVYSTIVKFDGSERQPPFVLSADKAGDQLAPDIAVLSDGRYVVTWQDDNASSLGDSSGSGIVGRVFNEDGSFNQNLFLANSETAGDQSAPSVAAIGDDFVVVWQGPDGIKGQIFDGDDQSLPDTYLLTREGLRNGSPVEDQFFVGPDGPNSFYFDVDAHSGHDIIFDSFTAEDLIITNRALPDPNGDRIIPEDSFYTFDLDGAGPDTDSFGFQGAGTDALRFLGTRTATGGQTVYAYGDAAVRPQGAIEGTLRNDTLRGTADKDVFFFDTALGAGLGTDAIKSFSAGDRIVTTTELFDDNHDGRIRLNSSDRLLFSTPAEDGPSSVKIFNQNDKAISTLVLDKIVTVNDHLSYYIYAAAGDTVSGADIFF